MGKEIFSTGLGCLNVYDLMSFTLSTDHDWLCDQSALLSHTHLNKMIIKLHVVDHLFSKMFYKIITSETMVWL